MRTAYFLIITIGFIAHACKQKPALPQQNILKINTLKIHDDSAHINIHLSGIPDTSYHLMGICWTVEAVAPNLTDKMIFFKNVGNIDTTITDLGTGQFLKFRTFLVSTKDTLYSDPITVEHAPILHDTYIRMGEQINSFINKTIRVGPGHILVLSSDPQTHHKELTLIDTTLQKVWETPLPSSGVIVKSEILPVKDGYVIVENVFNMSGDACKDIYFHYFTINGKPKDAWGCKRRGENHLSAVEKTSDTTFRVFYAGSSDCGSFYNGTAIADSSFTETYNLSGKLLSEIAVRSVQSFRVAGSMCPVTNGPAGQYVQVTPSSEGNSISWNGPMGEMHSLETKRTDNSYPDKIFRLNAKGDYLVVSWLRNQRHTSGLSWRILNERAKSLSPPKTYFHCSHIDSAKFNLSDHISRTRNGDYLLTGTITEKRSSQAVLLRLSPSGNLRYQVSPVINSDGIITGMGAYEEKDGQILFLVSGGGRLLSFKMKELNHSAKG